ncbi:MAG: hypothetical protein K6F14_07515 [Clostridiales bacterium]|nr:hypothetical protein [Clostridiales bacterium]
MLNDYFNEIRTKKITQFPKIEKKGTISASFVESTPVVWKGRLLRFEWVHRNAWDQTKNMLEENQGYFHFADMETNEASEPFAYGYSFGCAHVENDKMYAFGTRGVLAGHAIDTFVSDDLKTWKKIGELEIPEEFTVYNTSVCKGPDKYVMAIEMGGKSPLIGTVFTCFFAVSDDLANWELLPMDKYEHSKERYTACPVLRYVDGFYYMIYLERMPLHRYVPYIVRTKDFALFELGIKNPVMWFDDNDRKIYKKEWMSEKEIELTKNSVNINNSDLDVCEFNGKTVIMYSWGNQATQEFLAVAEYEGTLKEFFESFFN